MEKVISINDDWRWIIGGGNILKKTWRNRKRLHVSSATCFQCHMFPVLHVSSATCFQCHMFPVLHVSSATCFQCHMFPVPIMIYTYCYNLFLAYKVCLWKFGNYYNLFFAYKVCLWKFEYYCCPLIKDG